MWEEQYLGEQIYSKLINLSEVLLNCLMFNIIWLILNLPVSALLIQIALTTEMVSYQILIPLILLLLPFVFFPTTQALVNTMREVIITEKLLNIKVFFTCYLTSFKQSLFVGVLLTGLLTLFTFLSIISWYHSLLFFTLVIIGFFYLGMISLQWLFIEAHFSMGIYWKIKQAVLFVFAYPFSSIFILVIFILLQAILWNIYPIIYILCGMGISTYFSLYLFIKKYESIC